MGVDRYIISTPFFAYPSKVALDCCYFGAVLYDK